MKVRERGVFYETHLSPASSPTDITVETGSFVNLLVLDMDEYTEKYGTKTIRKNITIPAWLNT